MPMVSVPSNNSASAQRLHPSPETIRPDDRRARVRDQNLRPRGQCRQRFAAIVRFDLDLKHPSSPGQSSRLSDLCDNLVVLQVSEIDHGQCARVGCGQNQLRRHPRLCRLLPA